MRVLKLVVGLVVALWPLMGAWRPVSAQPIRQEPGWSDPVNLSHSGGASAPQIVVDADGVTHVVWDDVYGGSVYVRGVNQEWSTPVGIDLPFAGLAVELLADRQGNLHALWVDDERTLLHQRVNATGFGSLENWLPVNVLANGVANFDVTLDSQDQLQVAYVRLTQTNAFPAGVYALQSDSGGSGWTSPSPVFLSPYFRTLVPPEGNSAASAGGRLDEANIDIETTVVDGSNRTYVVWDQPALKRVYLAFASDTSGAWSSAQEIDAPDWETPYKLPQQIRVIANGPELLLLWHLGLTGGNCTAVYRASSDGGGTWDGQGNVFEGASTCPEALEVLRLPDGSPALLATLASQPYLLAWNGDRWSLPQGQAALDGVLDPATYSYVEFACLRGLVVQDSVLAVACDVTGNGDVWFTARPLGDVAGWFAPSTGWSASQAILIGTTAMTDLGLTAMPTGGTQAMWAQANDDGSGSTLSHASWQADQVGGPFPVLSPGGGQVSQLTTVLDGTGRLLAFWVDETARAIHFSWSEAQQASSSASWARVQAVPVPNTAVSSPQVAVGPASELYVLFGVPLNEGRGVYLVRSDDRGTTWTAPALVFDGTAGGCAYVDAPRLAVGAGGQLQALWTCASLPGVVSAAQLHQSRSEDRGQTWSSAERVADGSITWSALVAAGGNTLHRLWQEADAGGVVTWDARSTDDGLTWTSPESIALDESVVGGNSIVADASGGLHLVQYLQPAAERAQFHYWYWDGQGWAAREALPVESVTTAAVQFATTVDAAGRLAVVYARPTVPDANNRTQYELVYVSRPVTAATNEPTVEVTPGATPDATAAVVNPTLPAGEPSGTAEIPAATATPPLLDPAGDAGADQGANGLAVGAISAAVLVAGVGIYGVWRGRKHPK